MTILFRKLLPCWWAICGPLSLLVLSSCESEIPALEGEIRVLRKENEALTEKNEGLSLEVKKLAVEVSEQDHFAAELSGEKSNLTRIETHLGDVQGFIEQTETDRAKRAEHSKRMLADTKKLLALKREQLNELEPLFGTVDPLYSFEEGYALAQAHQKRLVDEINQLRAQVKKQSAQFREQGARMNEQAAVLRQQETQLRAQAAQLKKKSK